jgi:hypothetical protein
MKTAEERRGTKYNLYDYPVFFFPIMFKSWRSVYYITACCCILDEKDIVFQELSQKTGSIFDRGGKIANQSVELQDKTSLHILLRWLASTPIPP